MMALSRVLSSNIAVVLASIMLAFTDYGDGVTLLPVGSFKSRDLPRTLFEHYQSVVPPGKTPNDRVHVNISFSLYRVLDLDEELQLLDTSVWIRSTWNDSRLTWNPSLYNNITTLMTAYGIWIPDVVLFDNMRFDKRSIANHVKHVHYTGRVSWFGPAIYRTFCKLDSYYFPLDHQSCRFEFGSSTYGSVSQGVSNGSNRLDVGEFISSGEWAVGDMPATATTVMLPCCPLEKFDRVTYTLILQRNGANHLADTLLPIVLLMAMMVFSLYLPARSREKIFFSIIVLLTLTMFRLSTVGLKPMHADQTPLLEQCVAAAQAFVVITTVLNAVVVCLHDHGKYGWNVPVWLSHVVFTKVAKIVFYTRKVALYRINTEQAISKRRQVLEGITEMETSVHLDTDTDGVLSSVENVYEAFTRTVYVSPPTKWAKYMKLQKNITLLLKHLTSDMADRIRMERVRAEWGLVADIIGRLFLFVISLVFVVVVVTVTGLYLNADCVAWVH